MSGAENRGCGLAFTFRPVARFKVARPRLEQGLAAGSGDSKDAPGGSKRAIIAHRNEPPARGFACAARRRTLPATRTVQFALGRSAGRSLLRDSGWPSRPI